MLVCPYGCISSTSLCLQAKLEGMDEFRGIQGYGPRLLQISRRTPYLTAALIGHKRVRRFSLPQQHCGIWLWNCLLSRLQCIILMPSLDTAANLLQELMHGCCHFASAALSQTFVVQVVADHLHFCNAGRACAAELGAHQPEPFLQ